MRLPSSAAACLLAVMASPAAHAAEYGCLIEAFDTVDVRSPVEALIESIKVQRGDMVTKGQVLVQLESAAERAGLEVAKARATMTGEIKAAEARRKMRRAKRLDIVECRAL